jgi:hypothetical protein
MNKPTIMLGDCNTALSVIARAMARKSVRKSYQAT